MWSRKEIKENAKASLKRNYWKAVLGSLVLMIIGGGAAAGSSSAMKSEEVNSAVDNLFTQQTELIIAFCIVLFSALAVVFVIDFVICVFIKNPLQVGTQKLFINCKTDQAECSDMLSAFSGSYLNVVKTMFCMTLFTSLWSLLFIIPGIIKAYEYRMIPYILAENPDMSRKEVFAKSKAMMTGNKWKAFVLDLSFIGWHILGFCTCGIVELFYVAPYNFLADAELYHELKKQVNE